MEEWRKKRRARMLGITEEEEADLPSPRIQPRVPSIARIDLVADTGPGSPVSASRVTPYPRSSAAGRLSQLVTEVSLLLSQSTGRDKCAGAMQYLLCFVATFVGQKEGENEVFDPRMSTEHSTC
jgi:hypothetical protein